MPLANFESPVLHRNVMELATSAARDSVAGMAERLLCAPRGFVHVGGAVELREDESMDQLLADNLSRMISSRLSGTTGSIHVTELSVPSEVGASTTWAVAAASVRAPSGAVLGHVGAVDAPGRHWSTQDIAAIEAFARVLGSHAGIQPAVDSSDFHGHLRSLVQDVRALDDALAPLVQGTEERGDAVLRGRAATVRGRLAAVRGSEDRLRAEAGIAGPVAGAVDLALLVADLIADVEQRTECGPLRLDVDPGDFPVMTGMVATRSVLGQFLDHAVREFGSDAVSVRVRRQETSGHALHGRLRVELEVTVNGFVRTGDLARTGAGIGRARGLAGSGLHIEAQGDRVTVVGEDFHAESSSNLTRISACWSLNMG